MHPLQNSFRNICNWSDATMNSSNGAPAAMSPDPTSPSHLEMSDSSTMGEGAMKAMGDSMSAGAGAGHMMSADDPDNPQNWPIHKKIYASAVAFAFAWVV